MKPSDPSQSSLVRMARHMRGQVAHGMRRVSSADSAVEKVKAKFDLGFIMRRYGVIKDRLAIHYGLDEYGRRIG